MHKLDAYRYNNATHTCKKHNHFYLLSLRRRSKHHAQSDGVCDQLDQVKGNGDELVQCCVGLLVDDEESVQQLMESPSGIVFPSKQVSPDFVQARLVVARQHGVGAGPGAASLSLGRSAAGSVSGIAARGAGAIVGAGSSWRLWLRGLRVGVIGISAVASSADLAMARHCRPVRLGTGLWMKSDCFCIC